MNKQDFFQEIREEQKQRVRISQRELEIKLAPFFDVDLTRSIPKHNFNGPLFCAGRFQDNLTWICTLDFDSQIEMSFSYQKQRPNNWDIKQAFSLLNIKPLVEESATTGKVRHFIIQLGVLQ